MGFRAKTGRAIAVALAGSRSEPRFLLRREVSLIEPTIPETAEPYHAVMELPWDQAVAAARTFVQAIERQASGVLKELAGELRANGFALSGIGVVGSPDRNLEKIGNFHIRAHAAEGVTFRQVLETAAAQNAYPFRTFSDRTIGTLSPAEILKALGREAGTPWRIDERAAATAAWEMLTTA